MSQAYERGVDRIWVINIADIKPLELPFGFAMDLAWNTSSIDFDTIPNYLEAFASREFGPAHASEIAEILMEHSRLIGRRKYESVQAKTYSVINYHESERVLAEWQALADDVLSVLDKIPTERRDAYWHHVQYPILSGQAYHATVLGLGQNQQAGYERRNSANALADRVRADFERDFDLTEQYDRIVNGKWRDILAQPHYDQYTQTGADDWAEPTKDVLAGLWYTQLRQNASTGFGNLGIFAEGSGSAQEQARTLPSAWAARPTTDKFAPVLPILDPYGRQNLTVDLFHRGDIRAPITWRVDSPRAWVRVVPASGVLSKDSLEQRLVVSVDWDAVPEDFNETVDLRVSYDQSVGFDLVHLPVVNYRVPEGFVGFPETAGYVSIEGPHFQRRSSSSTSASGHDNDTTAADDAVTFAHIPYLGTRTGSGSLALRPYKAARASEATARAAWAEYGFYLYDDVDGALAATVYVNGALDTDPTLPMQFSLTLDDEDDDEKRENFTRLLGDPAQPGDTPPEWRTTVADHVWTRNVTLGEAKKGKHTLRWRTNSPEVYLEKIVLDTRGGVRRSYLGPPETMLLS